MRKKNLRIYIILLVIIMIVIGLVLIFLKNKEEKLEVANKVYLNDNELLYFSTYFSQNENYGFLLSDYNNPNEIDLDKVIYIGAGMKNKLTKEEEKEYLDIIKKQSIGTNITAVLKEDIEKLFFEKTGEKLLNIEEKLKNWVFLSKSNKYCYAHGDSNYSKMECTLGTKEDNTYILYVDSINGVIKNCKVTVEKIEERYIYKSNKTNYENKMN